MVRKNRMEMPGGVYHVIQRGNNKQNIYEDEIDKGFWVNQIKEMKEGLGFKVLAYILMDNHFHIILQTIDKELQVIMHRLNTRYSKHFNLKYERTGHVFGGRYKAFPILNDKYLLAALRYVHHNPVKAGVCQYSSQYKWSSDYFYRNNIGGFVDIDPILEMFGSDRSKAINEYKDFINKEVQIDFQKIGEVDVKKSFIIGEELRNEGVKIKSLDQVLRDTVIVEDEFQLIKQGSRKRSLTPLKAAYIMEALRLQYTNREIGKNINITDSAVAMLAKQ
jgi:putative transposase